MSTFSSLVWPCSSDHIKSDFFFLEAKSLSRGEKIKMQIKIGTFIFISNIQKVGEALPLNEK